MHLGLALENAALLPELRQALLREHGLSRALRRLEHLVGELSNDTEPELIWLRIVNAAASALGVERVGVYLVEPGGGLVLAAMSGSSAWFGPAIRQLSLGAPGGPVGCSAEEGRTVIVEDVRHEPSWAGFSDAPELRWVRAVWAVPVTSTDGEHLGAIAIFSDLTGAPSPEKVDLAQRFAFHASQALAARRKLALEVQDARSEVLVTLGRSIPHELGQPLAVISGYAELIAEGVLDGDKLRGACADLVAAARSLADRVQRLERLSTFVTKEYGAGRVVLDLDLSAEQSSEDAE
jgi:GAF domain-containing protein